ncbi:uncharacterized protein LOC118405244 isoform X2 [Branchiostoma floridae]|nr:uncharacterized protein LOC118405244 isoform X2 [Branchiostoma floridae]
MCFCQFGWVGTNCEISNFCASDPCQNGGTCSETAPGFECTCLGGWEGWTCNRWIDRPCDFNFCEHGGTCMLLVTGEKCFCTLGWDGRSCEKVFLGSNVETGWKLGDSVVNGNWSGGAIQTLDGDCYQPDRFEFRTWNTCRFAKDGGQAITNEQAHSGNFSWHLKRGSTSTSEGTPFSPPLRKIAGRVDRGYVADGNSFYVSFWFKMAGRRTDDSRVAVVAANPDGTVRSSNYMEIFTDDTFGLAVRTTEIFPNYTYCARTQDCFRNSYHLIVGNLPLYEWHRLDMTFVAEPIDYMDKWKYVVDEKATLIGGAFLAVERFDFGDPYEYVNRIKFQPQHRNQDDDHAGFYFDDIYYRVFNSSAPDVTLAEYGTSFEAHDIP